MQAKGSQRYPSYVLLYVVAAGYLKGVILRTLIPKDLVRSATVVAGAYIRSARDTSQAQYDGIAEEGRPSTAAVFPTDGQLFRRIHSEA
jgi:hypothetical protein